MNMVYAGEVDVLSVCRKTKDLGLHGVLRGFSGPVAWNTGCGR